MTDHRPSDHEDSTQELFEELRDRVCEQGVGTYGDYRQLVQELVQERLGEGRLDADEDLSTIEADLDARWPDIEATLR